MSIAVIGLSFHTAPVAWREQFTADDRDLDARLSLHASDGEIAILATCNRFEVYTADRADQPDAALRRARAFLAASGQYENARAFCYELTDAQAVEHLCLVAAGLDSMVLGEAQILGQVGDALQRALRCGASGRLLSSLFRHAIVAGRRVRTETALGQGAASISHAAVLKARGWLGDLRGKQILLVGAGKMAELAARALANHAVGGVRVLNRNPERAARVAQELGGVAGGWNELDDALAWADVVISSTGAPHTLIHAATVASIMRGRPDRPLALVDVAVPRDIDPQVAHVPQVYLADIDDLHLVAGEGLRDRAQSIPAARHIIAAETATYLRWLGSLDVTPTIAELRDQAERVRTAELQRALRHLGNLSPREQRAVETLSVALVNKLLHTPIIELKRHAGDARFVEMARDLFALEDSATTDDIASQISLLAAGESL